MGREQAEASARLPLWDAVDRIVLSSEAKTRLTVAPLLAARSLPVVVDPRFDELRRGSAWLGDYGARVAEVLAKPDRSIGGWETAHHALSRFLDGLHALRQAFPAETLALVGHGLTFSLFRAHLMGRERVDFDDWQRLSFCAVAAVDWPAPQLINDFEPAPGAPSMGRGRRHDDV